MTKREIRMAPPMAFFGDSELVDGLRWGFTEDCGRARFARGTRGASTRGRYDGRLCTGNGWFRSADLAGAAPTGIEMAPIQRCRSALKGSAANGERLFEMGERFINRRPCYPG